MKKKSIVVSINPTYYCNFRCSFCYLGDMLSDKTTIPLERVTELLNQLSMQYDIDHIDIYGGEITALSDEYAEGLIDILSLFSERITIISNFSRVPSYFYRDNVDMTASYDYKARQDHDKVHQNMVNFNKQLDVLMLASKAFLRFDAETVINKLNEIPNLTSVEIKPYSTNQFNQQDVSFKDFEELVKSYIIRQGQMNFEFCNIGLIESVLEKERNSFSDDHIYITPNGKYGVLEFDENDNEFFMELDTVQDYINWTKTEKLRVSENSYCSTCEYYGSCLSEHLREVTDISKSCNGFKHLIDWYRDEQK